MPMISHHELTAVYMGRIPFYGSSWQNEASHVLARKLVRSLEKM
jgi:hypothetical protein